MYDSNTSLVLFSIVLIISSLPLFYFSLGRTGNGWMDGIGMGWDGKGRQAKERYGRKRIYVFRFPPPLFWLCVCVCVYVMGIIELGKTELTTHTS